MACMPYQFTQYFSKILLNRYITPLWRYQTYGSAITWGACRFCKRSNLLMETVLSHMYTKANMQFLLPELSTVSFSMNTFSSFNLCVLQACVSQHNYGNMPSIYCNSPKSQPCNTSLSFMHECVDNMHPLLCSYCTCDRSHDMHMRMYTCMHHITPIMHIHMTWFTDGLHTSVPGKYPCYALYPVSGYRPCPPCVRGSVYESHYLVLTVRNIAANQ